MNRIKLVMAGLLAAALAFPPAFQAANHREAPITALDHKADITDVYAFRSYNGDKSLDKVTFIMCVDPLLEPANGPTLFPFDPEILYEIKIDNNQTATEDIVFQFRFKSDIRLPHLYTAVAGIGDSGARRPGTGELIVPPQIRTFDNPGLNLVQTYSVTMLNKGMAKSIANPSGDPLYAVPANAGPRTMDYGALFDQAVYDLGDGIKVFVGTVDDPFWIDLGAAFDTANFRTLGSGVPGVLTDTEDSATENFASDTVSGYAVNAIAIEVPISMVTRPNGSLGFRSPNGTIGVWATTSRPREMAVNRGRFTFGPQFRQVQRMGHPLINELIIGLGSKDRFSMDVPKADAQFAKFFLDPPIVRVVEALYGGVLTVPNAPRLDLLPLVTYAEPIINPLSADFNKPGPTADILRLNTMVRATPASAANRLGLIAGDPAGYPNGRRLMDDVVDIVLRVGVGGVLTVDADGESLNRFPNNRLGDGVNVNDAPYRTTFPYLANSPSGRNRRHIDPGEEGGGPVE